ncbi:hypothetical protein CDAR_445841 [Caerostris darwini]|uniref:Uncharacterized protein n=1 Tax=Caerostris darwini TaxID=1538125 RepID=A0AAV4U0F1_9ARAC|nr:hypothetical protein CDAR_445841 [Caerostris darwini]
MYWRIKIHPQLKITLKNELLNKTKPQPPPLPITQTIIRHPFTAALPLASYHKSHPRKHFQSQTFTRALLGIYQKGVLQYLSPILQRHSFRPLTSGTGGVERGGGRGQQLKVLIPPKWKESRSRKENPICQENHPLARDAPHGIFWNVRRAERIAT